MNVRFTQIKRQGFSLVELLVAISIIGILISVVYTNFGAARELARDDRRQTDLKQMELALELYKAQTGRYPAACRGANSWSGEVGTSFACPSGGEYVVGLTPDYIASLPTDPNSGGSQSFVYRVNPDGSEYKLMALRLVERNTIQSINDDFARCPVPIGACGNISNIATTYAVYSPGAEEW